MIEELKIVCSEISMIETRYTLGNNIEITLNNVDTDFLPEIEAEEIVKFQEVDNILEAIGVEEVSDWLKGKGSL